MSPKRAAQIADQYREEWEEIAPHQTLCGPAEFMCFARAVERAILDRLGMKK